MDMPNLQPLPPASTLTARRYGQILDQAWQQTQGRLPRRMPSDDALGRAAEAGRSRGPGLDRPAQRFALELLQSLQRSGCTQIGDAIRAARALTEPEEPGA
jgi:hypothetical protein